ncbi:MAG: ORF6N domain-containing protein [Pseudomonadota bacterium]
MPSHLLAGAIFPVGSENRHHKFGILNRKNRNLNRFPAHFMHQLTTKEFTALKSQIATSKSGCGVKHGEVGRPNGSEKSRPEN